MGLLHRRPPANEERDAAWRRYAAFCTDEPARSPEAIQAVILAAGLCYEDAGTSFWHSLRADWLAGEQDLEPFEDAPGANQEYRVLATLRGLLPACAYCGTPLQDPTARFCGLLCRNGWREASRPAFTAPPLALPAEQLDPVVRLIAGEPVTAEEEAALAAWLDRAPSD